MTRGLDTTFEAACMGKKPLTESLAWRISAKHARRGDKTRRPYRCRFCGHWHVGRVGK